MGNEAKKRSLVDGIRFDLNVSSNLWKFFLILPIIISLFVIASNSALAVDGCYIFSEGSSDLVCETSVAEEIASADCSQFGNCDFTTAFFPGQLCDETQFEEACRQVRCTVDCDFHPLSVCSALGGSEIPPGNEAEWCSEGCCSVGTFCGQLSIQAECVDRADLQGIDPSEIIYQTGLTSQECQTTICGVTTETGSVSGHIYDDLNQPLSGAIIQLTNYIETTSGADGSYSFSSVTPGAYTLNVNKEGYSSEIASIVVVLNSNAEQDLTLIEVGLAVDVTGTITDGTSSLPLSQANVCVDGLFTGCTLTQSDGTFSFSLEPGDYTVVVSKIGFSAIEEQRSTDNLPWDISTIAAAQQGISGEVRKDTNNNGLFSSADELAYGARVYVNGIFRGTTQYPSGRFTIPLDPGTYLVHATFEDYISEDEEFVVESNLEEDKNILVRQVLGECSYGQPDDTRPVSIFSASHVLGQAAVELTWVKPCPQVSSYSLTKNGVPLDTISPLSTQFTDLDVEWGQSYEYEIKAQYADGMPRESEPTTATILLGTELCEGTQYAETFCQVNEDSTTEDERKYVYSCDSTNNIIVSGDCLSLDTQESDWYCTRTRGGNAVCKDAGQCNVLQQLADPFGLYYDSATCYGPENSVSGFENFCYYDYTNSVVDSCESCADVTSCFNYKSEGACGINNCLGVGCEWINTGTTDLLTLNSLYPVTEETGHGYCVETDYSDDDFCSLCGPDGDLFENSLCTAQVCTSLGSCFSDEALSECHDCGDEPTSESNCHEYATPLECVGDSPISMVGGVIQSSNDQCSWGVCSWVGTDSQGYCVKDANVDGADDCEQFVAGEKASCKLDIIPPTTSIVGDQVIVSSVQETVTFLGVDESSSLREIWFCLDSVSAPSCTNFESVSYDTLLSQKELEIDIFNSDSVQSRMVDGETYSLRYYSIDKYFNQEQTNEAFIYVDNTLPMFTIEHSEEITADEVDVTLFLTGLNEPMACILSLQPVVPFGPAQAQSFTRDDDKNHLFASVRSPVVLASAECTDDAGNVNNATETIVFDLEQDITIINPELDSAISQTEIEFQVETIVSSVCELYQFSDSSLTYGKVADFIPSNEEQKEHVTNPVSGFSEGEYQGTVKVVCRETATSDILEDYFSFVIDFTAPNTDIVLTEGNREVLLVGNNWEEYFIEEASVSFECDGDGFLCDQTYYCIGPECSPSNVPDYTAYSGNLVVTETSNVCYFSNDVNGMEEVPKCGTINVNGFGINLVIPTAYTYENEVWGVSNLPIFDLSIMTMVDTNYCVFDFNDQFDIYSQPPYKQLSPNTNSQNHYSHPDFPGQVLDPYSTNGGVKSIFVKCHNNEGNVSPSQKINLEYDPTAPVIRSLYVEPVAVFEGIEVSLLASTDDKTVCKFSDNSEGQGSSEFDTMEYSFPGFDENILNTEHLGRFIFSFDGAQKSYELNVQCMNAAGNLSEVEQANFDVDYSASGYIISANPQGYISGVDVVLEVETNKNAYCVYDNSSMESTGGRLHTQVMGTVPEGEYQYLVSCNIGEQRRESEISFIVDMTPPVVTRVDDGTLSCSLDTLHLLIYTSEENISAYNYELYKGLPVNSVVSRLGINTTMSVAETLISTGLLPGGNGTILTGLSLEENETYFIKILAEDGAGNAGEFTASDGFTAVTSDHGTCLIDSTLPAIDVSTNESCTDIDAELYCNDELGCGSITYGISPTLTECTPTRNYLGNKISVTQSTWVCYEGSDVSGNSFNGSRKINFLDTDGDGISNSCDECSGTVAGKSVGITGCALGQSNSDDSSKDKDNDRLPDFWEKLFDATGCELNYLAMDSSGSGTPDNEEDYDGDGYNNYDEYTLGNDPCLADAPPVASTDTASDSQIPTDNDFTSDSEDSNLTAWLVFIFGFLSSIGGIGTLVYYYIYTPTGKSIFQRFSSGKPSRMPQEQSIQRAAPSEPNRPSMFDQLKEAVNFSQRKMVDKKKQKQRTDIFSSFKSNTPKEVPNFNKQSKEFTHFKDIMSSRRPRQEKVGNLVDRFQENKKEIKAGLQPHEKGLFGKLDQLAKGTSKKPSKKQSGDIFKELRKLSDKRKR